MTDIRNEPYRRAAEYKRTLWSPETLAKIKDTYMSHGWRDIGVDVVAKFGMYADFVFDARHRVLEVHIRGELPGTVAFIETFGVPDEADPCQYAQNPFCVQVVLLVVLRRLYDGQYRRFSSDMWAVLPKYTGGIPWVLHCQKIRSPEHTRVSSVPRELNLVRGQYCYFILQAGSCSPWLNWTHAEVGFAVHDQRVVQWPNPAAILWMSQYDLDEVLFIASRIGTSKNGRVATLDSYEEMKCAQRDFPTWLE